MQNENNRMNAVLKTALENISGVADANTVIGKPVFSDGGEMIIPLSKITLGVLSGGGEYGKVGLFKNGSDLPFSVGNGALVSLKPYGFLVKEKDGGYKFIPTEKDAYEKVFDKVGDILTGLKENTDDKN